jgi:hypothetical protein
MGRFIGNGQQTLALFVTELMGWCGSTRLGPRIFGPLPPSLHGADAQLQHRARWREPGTGGNRFIEQIQHLAAI